MTIKKQIIFTLSFSIAVLCGCSNGNNQNADEVINDQSSITTDGVSTAESISTSENIRNKDDVLPTTNTTTNSTEPEKKESEEGEITLEVILPENGRVETRSGEISNIDLNRPSSLKRTEVFDGWKQEVIVSQIFEGTISNNESLTLTANSIDISNSDNVIYNDVTYVNSGMDSISIPVTVGGNTNFAIMELEISYDTSLLEFESFVSKDTDVECNCPEPGLIYISFVSTDNVSADIELCNIQFKNISAEGAETSLKYNIKDLAAWNTDKTDYINVNYEVINSRIVMF